MPTTKTANYLVRLNRSAVDRLSDDDYHDVGASWGAPGDDTDIETHAILMVYQDQVDAVEDLMDSDPGVIEYEPCA